MRAVPVGLNRSYEVQVLVHVLGFPRARNRSLAARQLLALPAEKLAAAELSPPSFLILMRAISDKDWLVRAAAHRALIAQKLNYEKFKAIISHYESNFHLGLSDVDCFAHIMKFLPDGENFDRYMNCSKWRRLLVVEVLSVYSRPRPLDILRAQYLEAQFDPAGSLDERAAIVSAFGYLPGPEPAVAELLTEIVKRCGSPTSDSWSCPIELAEACYALRNHYPAWRHLLAHMGKWFYEISDYDQCECPTIQCALKLRYCFPHAELPPVVVLLAGYLFRYGAWASGELLSHLSKYEFDRRVLLPGLNHLCFHPCCMTMGPLIRFLESWDSPESIGPLVRFANTCFEDRLALRAARVALKRSKHNVKVARSIAFRNCSRCGFHREILPRLPDNIILEISKADGDGTAYVAWDPVIFSISQTISWLASNDECVPQIYDVISRSDAFAKAITPHLFQLSATESNNGVVQTALEMADRWGNPSFRVFKRKMLPRLLQPDLDARTAITDLANDSEFKALCHAAIYKSCGRQVASVEDEILNEVLTDLYIALGKPGTIKIDVFKHNSFVAFMKNRIYRKSIDKWRSQAREQRGREKYWAYQSQRQKHATVAALQQEVIDVINDLKTDDSKIIRGRYYDRLTLNELAAELHSSTTTVHRRHSQLLECFQVLLRD